MALGQAQGLERVDRAIRWMRNGRRVENWGKTVRQHQGGLEAMSKEEVNEKGSLFL